MAATNETLPPIAETDPEILVYDLKLRLLPRVSRGLAHDLNNLLTVIGGFTEVALAMTSDHPTIAGHLDCVKQACRQATVLNERLLAYAGGFAGPTRAWRLGDLAEGFRKPLANLLGSRVPCSIEVNDRAVELQVSEAELHCLVLGVAAHVHDCLERMDRFEVHFRPTPLEGSGLQARIRAMGKVAGGRARTDAIAVCGMLARSLSFAFSQDITDQPGVAFDFRLDGAPRSL